MEKQFLNKNTFSNYPVKRVAVFGLSTRSVRNDFCLVYGGRGAYHALRNRLLAVEFVVWPRFIYLLVYVIQ